MDDGATTRNEHVGTGMETRTRMLHELVSAIDHHDNQLFRSLLCRCKSVPPIATATCWPCNAVSFSGVAEAHEAGIIEPVLVGPRPTLQKLAASQGRDISLYRIVDVRTEEEASAASVQLCRNGETAALMKGSLHTDVMMHAVLDKANGLQTRKRVSHVFVMEAPLYERPLLITDAAINIYPSLMEKAGILQNAIDLAHILGIAKPKVAVLSAVETVCAGISSTIDAAALCKMSEREQIHGAEVDGPLAFDTAVSLEAANLKQLKSSVAGKADILLAPDIEAGNMLAKQLEYLGAARLAGIVLGATVPIVLTSRADSTDARMASCAIASLLVGHSRAEHSSITTL